MVTKEWAKFLYEDIRQRIEENQSDEDIIEIIMEYDIKWKLK